jgi:hypothetical protein
LDRERRVYRGSGSGPSHDRGQMTDPHTEGNVQPNGG